MHVKNCVRRSAAVIALLTATECSQPAEHIVAPSSVLVAPLTWPTPQTLPSGAPPHILDVWINQTTIRSGRQWFGRIVTSTNVASVEVRTESFSFTADRRGFGVFAFSQEILDIISQYRRAYALHIIARNTCGDVDEWVVPIVIR
jgi:hypothetical protein